METLRIDVRSTQTEKISAAWVKRILTDVLTSEKAHGELSVLFVDERKIATLNRRYRRKVGPTDVLAFPGSAAPSEIAVLGDIVIAVPVAIRQAKTQRHPVSHEIAFLLIHGVLHLLGYDHQKSRERKKMFEKQERYWKSSLKNAN